MAEQDTGLSRLPDPQELLAALDSRRRPAAADGDALRDLLARCDARLAAQAARGPEPIRTLHHFACTGGTLLSKAVASMPNTVVLSEIDPLSTLHLRAATPPFAPTDLITGLRYSPRQIGQDTIVTLFRAGLLALRDDLAGRGMSLVLRDHAHSQFCTGQDWTSRPSLHQMVSDCAPSLGLVTVRHPLDSFLSLEKNRWLHFSPATLEEYCRRYMDFLASHADLPQIRYEDFVADPAEIAQQICAHLALEFDPNFEISLPLARLSGDSGRSGTRIGPRERPALPPALRRDADESPSYAALCAKLGYEA